MHKKTPVIIAVFIQNEKVLVEKRFLKNFKGEQYLIPGGKIKKDMENIEQALKREVLEELGVTVIEFTPLFDTKVILGLKGQQLIPFLIQKWAGKLPKNILDTGNLLQWIEIEKVLNTPVKPTREIVQALKKHLTKKIDSYATLQNDGGAYDTN